MMKRPSYRRSVQWLSHRFVSSSSVEMIARDPAVQAVAHAFFKLPVETAIQVRKKLDVRKGEK